MVDVINKKCKCGKARPSFNEPGETKPICCKDCATNTMVDVVSKKCKCGKARPLFNEHGETKPICCKDCKTDTMVDVVSKKCKCGKARPCYNEHGETKPICCKDCKTDTMVDVVSKKCKCGKTQPIYNEPGETKPICCKDCKTNTMVDVINKKCKGQDGLCTVRANHKYKGYCTFCFTNTFPNDPLTLQIRSKSKEIAVRDYINIKFDGFIHDRLLQTSHCDCTVRRRPDHRKIIGNTMIVIETDENQHKSYDEMNEQTRYDDLYMAYSGKWIYIRFNPDKYISKNGRKKNPTISTRLVRLEQEINKQINRADREENNDLVERIYLYYDNFD